MKKILTILAAVCALVCSCGERSSKEVSQEVSPAEYEPLSTPLKKEQFIQINIVVDDTERTVGIYPGSSWTIVDTEDILGVNLNIKPKR